MRHASLVDPLRLPPVCGVGNFCLSAHPGFLHPTTGFLICKRGQAIPHSVEWKLNYDDGSGCTTMVLSVLKNMLVFLGVATVSFNHEHFKGAGLTFNLTALTGRALHTLAPRDCLHV